MNKKVIFIPGWLYSPVYFTLGDGLDVWQEDVDLNVPRECDYLIGHSMGAAIALKIWSLDRTKDLILVDPFIEQKNVWRTFVNFLKFAWHEKLISFGLVAPRHVPRNLKKVWSFPEEDYWEILKSVPREKIKILHGENDLFLCGRDVCAKFQELGVEVIEVPEAGHDWHKNFDDIIEKIVNN